MTMLDSKILQITWEYLKVTVAYWWLVVPGVLMPLPDIYKHFIHPQGKELALPRWLRWGTGLICLFLAQFLAYRNQAINLARVIEDKRQLSMKANALNAESDALKKNAKGPLYGFGPDNEYASISNVVGALSFLAHAQSFQQPLNKNPCVLKITSPQENIETAQIVATLAGQFGCAVTGPRNPNFDPEIDRQTTEGMLADAVVVHAAKDNEQVLGFATDLANVFAIKRKYGIPKGSPPNLIWLQFGTGSVWRKP